jgi:hypothetical protein
MNGFLRRKLLTRTDSTSMLEGAGLNGRFGRIQCRLSLTGYLSLRDQVDEFGFESRRRVIVADFHAGRSIAKPAKTRFHPVIAENRAYTQGVLRQNGDDLFEGNDFDILLNAAMLSTGKMASVGDTWFTQCLSINQINLEDARMELRDSAQIHAERPHCFQWRVDDDLLHGSKLRWQMLPPNRRGPGA